MYFNYTRVMILNTEVLADSYLLQIARELLDLRIAYKEIQMIGIKKLVNMNRNITHQRINMICSGGI